MKTSRITINKDYIDRSLMAQAGEIIRNGGLVAFPTETVYGLGADAENPEASKKIYEAKGRPSDNPLIVHICDTSQVYEIAKEVPSVAERLFGAFWPGPMTVILKKNDRIPYETTGGLDTVAIRMPSHPVARALIKESGRMIAAPSANASGRPSPTRADHVWEDLEGRIDMLIDGGDVDLGLESTIIDLSEGEPMILRPGFITRQMLSGIIGEVHLDPALEADYHIEESGEDSSEEIGGLHPKAPGMKYRHYAPRGSLEIVEGQPEDVIDYINKKCQEATDDSVRSAVLCINTHYSYYINADEVIPMGEYGDEAATAARLFDVLRRMDEDCIDRIYSESFTSEGVGEAVMNRLLKAAGHKVIFAG